MAPHQRKSNRNLTRDIHCVGFSATGIPCSNTIMKFRAPCSFGEFYQCDLCRRRYPIGYLQSEAERELAANKNRLLSSVTPQNHLKIINLRSAEDDDDISHGPQRQQVKSEVEESARVEGRRGAGGAELEVNSDPVGTRGSAMWDPRAQLEEDPRFKHTSESIMKLVLDSGLNKKRKGDHKKSSPCQTDNKESSVQNPATRKSSTRKKLRWDPPTSSSDSSDESK